MRNTSDSRSRLCVGCANSRREGLSDLWTSWLAVVRVVGIEEAFDAKDQKLEVELKLGIAEIVVSLYQASEHSQLRVVASGERGLEFRCLGGGVALCGLRGDVAPGGEDELGDQGEYPAGRLFLEARRDEGLE